MDTGSIMANQMDNLIEAGIAQQEEYYNELIVREQRISFIIQLIETYGPNEKPEMTDVLALENEINVIRIKELREKLKQ